MARNSGDRSGRRPRHGSADGGPSGQEPGIVGRATRHGLFGRRGARKASHPQEAAPEQAISSAEGERPDEAGKESSQRVGERIEIPCVGGATLRALLLSNEQPSHDVPGVLWIHGDAPSEVASAPAEPAVAKLLWDHRPCVVLCLDHPATIGDCHLALTWLRDNARAWGVACDQLMVGGEGMGANLVIQLCRYERDEGHVGVAWQLPLYPSLDANWLEGLPGMVQTLGYRGLPPATTLVGTDDFSREATIAFVEGMRSDGVEVDFHMYRGHFSGTGMWGENASVREARSFVLRQFDEAVQVRRTSQRGVRTLDLPSID